MKMPVNSSSASVNQKQFWIEIRLDVSRKQGPKHIGPDLDPNCLKLKVFLIFLGYFSEKGHFEENQKATLLKSHTNLPSMYTACCCSFFLNMICFINKTTKAALLLYMLPALNYPVGLHDLCLDSTAASYFKPSHESSGAADLNLWRSPLW